MTSILKLMERPLTHTTTARVLYQMAFNKRIFKLAAVAGSAAVVSGGFYGYSAFQASRMSTKAIHMNTEKMQLESVPKIEPTERRVGPTNLNFDLTLYQYYSCPFCCKTRTLLDYFGLNYNIVEVDPVFKKKLSWSEKYKKVPTLIAHGKDGETEQAYQICDSSVIISSLGSYLLSKRKDVGRSSSSLEVKTLKDLENILVNYQAVEVDDTDGKKRRDIPNKYFLMLGEIGDLELEKRESNLAEERRWREWTDKVLVHSLSPNIYRTVPEAMQAFKNFSQLGKWDERFTFVERFAAVYLGSAVMWMVSKGLKRKYRLKEDVRESLYDDCRYWTKAIGKNRKFMGGDRPNLADLSVYGVLSSIEGCEAFDDVLKNTNIGPWYEGVKECCRSHTGSEILQSI